MGFLKSIFSKKDRSPKEPFDLSSLKVDMHSHLIPGIDDGAEAMDHTIGMLLKFVELGYKKVITTPHVMSDYYKNTPEIILGGLEKVRAEIKKLNIPIEIEAAAEYYFDDRLLEKIKSKEVLTFGGNKVLFEFPFTSKPSNITQLIFDFKTHGYQPVLAHYERYIFYHDKGVEDAIKFKEKGVDIQMNLLSLAGGYGRHIKKQSQLMIENDVIDYLGTDCHRIEHLHAIESAVHQKEFIPLKEMKFKNKDLL